MHPWPDLRAILDGFPWAIVGGVATRAYMAERMTKHLDIRVRRADSIDVIQRFVAAGFSVVSDLALPGKHLQAPDGAEVDVLWGDQPWLDAALAEPERDAAGYPVIGLLYLVLLKLQAARTQDWADVSRMLGQVDPGQLDAVRALVSQLDPEDSEDLEALIYLGQQEMLLPPGDSQG